MPDPELLAELQELMAQQPNPTQVDSAKLAATALAAKELARTLTVLYEQRARLCKELDPIMRSIMYEIDVWEKTGKAVISGSSMFGDQLDLATLKAALRANENSPALKSIDAEIDDVKQLIRDICGSQTC